jgi:hypothetical protein
MFQRDYIDWPKDEPIPQSIEEALALGWQASGGESEFSDDERIETGTVTFTKKLGNVNLSLNVPYRAERTYGKAVNHKACVETIDGRSVRDYLATGGRRGHAN